MTLILPASTALVSKIERSLGKCKETFPFRFQYWSCVLELPHSEIFD